MYNSKNYTEQGGEVTHIGGKLVIDSGGTVEGITPGESSYTLPVASADILGGVKAKAKSNEAAEIAVDADGKLYYSAYKLPAATASAIGGVKLIAHQDDAADTEDIVTKYNELLAALRTAGLMAAE